MKNIFVVIAAIIVCSVALKHNTRGEPYGSCSEDVNWSFDADSHTLTISGTGKMTCVTNSEVPWKEFVDDIQHVEVDGVSSIEANSFVKHESMTSVNIGDTVNSIGKYAFSNCTNLETVTIPVDSNISSIGQRAFEGCAHLKSFIVPGNVSSISEGAFYGCSNLENVTFINETKITSIGSNAFNGCYSLSVFNIPPLVTYIGERAFYNCRSLVKLDFPSGVGELGELTFYNCSKLENLTILTDSKLFFMWRGVFMNCASLKSIYIPPAVKWMGQSAFLGCRSLEEFEFPYELDMIQDYTLADCSSLKRVTIPQDTGMTQLGFGVFLGCSSLQSVVLPPSINRIGWNLFYDCTSLISIDIPPNLTSIEQGTFHGCSKLVRVGFPYNTKVSSFGDNAFEECNSLTTFEIPSTLNTIHGTPFRGCNNLTTVIYHGYSDPGFLNAFNFCDKFKFVCVPQNFSDNVYHFSPYCKADTVQDIYDSCLAIADVFDKQTSECFSVKCQGGNLTVEQTYDAWRWEEKTTPCFEYKCVNDTGLVYWSKCNSSGNETNMCYDRYQCDVFDRNHYHGYYAEIILEGAKYDDYDKDEFDEVIYDITGMYGFSTFTEMNDKGDLTRLVVAFGNPDDAKKLVKGLKKIKPDQRTDILKFMKGVNYLDYSIHSNSETQISCAVLSQEITKVMIVMMVALVYVLSNII